VASLTRAARDVGHCLHEMFELYSSLPVPVVCYHAGTIKSR